MQVTVAKLKKTRLTVLSVNLVYFLAVLALGFLIFVKDLGGWMYGLVAAALVLYFAVVRPTTARYKRAVREALLRENVCRGCKDFTYDPKKGFTSQEFGAAGLMPGDAGKAFLSRELVTARQGSWRLRMADVTFPVKVDGLNAMFSGMLLEICSEDREFPELRLDGENWYTEPVNADARQALDDLKARGGQLLLQSRGRTLYLLVRGSFLGFPVTPLLNVTEKTMVAELLPEVRGALRVSQTLCSQGRDKKGKR